MACDIGYGLQWLEVIIRRQAYLFVCAFLAACSLILLGVALYVSWVLRHAVARGLWM